MPGADTTGPVIVLKGGLVDGKGKALVTNGVVMAKQ